MGEIFVNFLFQLSFATTATTIVSGAMAERYTSICYTKKGISKCVKNMSKYDLNLQITLVELIFRANFHAYCLFSLVNTIVYCIPAGWLWNTNGFLKQLGVVDIAGSGGVHLIGGSSGICNIY